VIEPSTTGAQEPLCAQQLHINEGKYATSAVMPHLVQVSRPEECSLGPRLRVGANAVLLFVVVLRDVRDDPMALVEDADKILDTALLSS
jgi:hypothetical protein